MADAIPGMSINAPQYLALGKKLRDKKAKAAKAAEKRVRSRAKRASQISDLVLVLHTAAITEQEVFDEVCTRLEAVCSISDPKVKTEVIKAIRQIPSASFSYFRDTENPPATDFTLVRDIKAAVNRECISSIRDVHLQYPRETDEPCSGCPGANAAMCGLTTEPGRHRTFAIRIESSRDHAVQTLHEAAARLSAKTLGPDASLMKYWERMTKTPGLWDSVNDVPAVIKPVVEVLPMDARPSIREQYVEFVIRTSNVKACSAFVQWLVRYNVQLSGADRMHTVNCVTPEYPYAVAVDTTTLEMTTPPLTIEIHDMSSMIGKGGRNLKELNYRLQHENNTDYYGRDRSTRQLKTALYPVYASPHIPVLVTVYEFGDVMPMVDDVDVMEIQSAIKTAACDPVLSARTYDDA
jgi:hypothetical protein